MKNNIGSRIIYEDNHFIAINKLCGEPVQSDSSGDTPLIDSVKSYIKERDNKPGNVFLGLIHRLDRPTSGIILFAKTSKGLSRMNEVFRAKKVEKKYYAILDKQPTELEGKLKNYIKKNEKQNKSYIHKKKVSNSKLAELDYKVVGRSEKYILVDIKLLTGRHHQIRTQFAELGCHIKGDLKYGAKRSNHYSGIALHSYKMSFIQPISKKKIDITAPCPKSEQLWNFFNT